MGRGDGSCEAGCPSIRNARYDVDLITFELGMNIKYRHLDFQLIASRNTLSGSMRNVRRGVVRLVSEGDDDVAN